MDLLREKENMAMFYFMNIDKQIKCNRCLLVYKPEFDECPHCSALTDLQVKTLIEERKKNNPYFNKIAKLFYILIIAIFLLMLIFNNN